MVRPTQVNSVSKLRAIKNFRQNNQAGLTMVELLVAMVISSVVIIAAFSALIVSRQGFTATDSASQLRDNARFLTDHIQRIGVQAGYLDYKFATAPQSITAIFPEPDVKGFNNALANLNTPTMDFTPRDASSLDGSDVLVLRYQASETYPGSNTPDNAMVNCMGSPAPKLPQNRDDRVANIFHIKLSDADQEPSLMCTTMMTSSSNIVTIETQSLVRGVETFQVLYGVDGVIPNTPLPATLTTTANIPTKYLRADQMVVPGSPNETNKNWGRVRSLLVGMVIRGPAGSAPENVSQTYYPFGTAPASTNGTKGSSMMSVNDVGTKFQSPKDNRLRQVVTFVVHLRNGQE